MIYEESAFKKAVKSYTNNNWETLNVSQLILEKVNTPAVCEFTSNLIDATQRLDVDAQRDVLISAGADANTVGGFKDCMAAIKRMLSDSEMVKKGYAIYILDIALQNIGRIRYKDGIIVVTKHTNIEEWVIRMLDSFRPSLNIAKVTSENLEKYSDYLQELNISNSRTLPENQFEDVYRSLSDKTKDVVDKIMEFRFTTHDENWDAFKDKHELRDIYDLKSGSVDVGSTSYTLDINKQVADYMKSISKDDIAGLRQAVLLNRELAQAGVDTSSSEYLNLEGMCKSLLVLWKKDIIETFSYSDTGKEQYAAYVATKYVSRLKSSKAIALCKVMQCAIVDGLIDIENPIIAHKQMLSCMYRLLYDKAKFKQWINGDYIICISGSLSVDMRVLLNVLLENKMSNYKCLENTQVIAFSYDEADAYYEAVQQLGEKKEKVNTVAQDAFEEISKALYNEQLGLYRDNQFSNNKTIVLNTIFDEIPVVFQAEACIRPGFSIENGKVTVPTVFANIKGTGGKTDEELTEFISSLAPGDHRYLFINEHVASANEDYNRVDNEGRVNLKLIMNDAIPKFEASTLYNAGVLNREALRNVWSNRFSKLSLDRQIYLLNKIEELCRSYPTSIDANPALIIQIASTLPNFVLQDLTWFDFTKVTPKVVFAYTGEFTMSKTDAVFLHLLNALGYDVVAFTPSGYTGLECCGSLNTQDWIFNTLDLGKPRFDFDFKDGKSASDVSFIGYLKKFFT